MAGSVIRPAPGQQPQQSRNVGGASRVMSVAEIKEEGVKLFKNGSYKAAAEKFTEAIELDEPGSEELKAMCYNNRAAAREKINAPRSVLIEDASAAITLKPDYTKAYAKRHRLHFEEQLWEAALAGLYAWKRLEPRWDQAALRAEQTCLQHLVGQRRAVWDRENAQRGGERPIPVRHGYVHRWMSSFMGGDGLLADVCAHRTGGLRDQGVYSTALSMLVEKKYDEIDDYIVQWESEVGERAAECWLLVALIRAIKGRRREAGAFLASARGVIDALPEGARKQALRIAGHVVAFENAATKDELEMRWGAAQRFAPSSSDLWMQYYTRMTYFDESAAWGIAVGPQARSVFGEKYDYLRFPPCASRDPLATLNEFLAKQRAVGLGGFFNIQMPPLYKFLGRNADALRVMREIAEAEGESIHWYGVSTFAASQQEQEGALNRCLQIEPLNYQANFELAHRGMKQLEKPLTREEGAVMLSYMEKALMCMDAKLELDGAKKLPSMFRLHEQIKAYIRVSEMLG